MFCARAITHGETPQVVTLGWILEMCSIWRSELPERHVIERGAQSMKQRTERAILNYLARSRDVLQMAIDDPGFAPLVTKIVDRVADALRGGKKVLLVGNGGSAADAQHIAGEFLSRLNYDRAPVAAIALTTDSSVMTAIGNDYGYERLFERQVFALGRPGDVLIALSTSGRSQNVLYALDAGQSVGIVTIGFTGQKRGEKMSKRCDLCLRAPSESTPLIQQIHITVGHVVCELVEERLFPRDGTKAAKTIHPPPKRFVSAPLKNQESTVTYRRPARINKRPNTVKQLRTNEV